MADAEAQARWRQRVSLGEILPICEGEECEKKLRIDSSHAPLCRDCWRGTDEGKAYLAEKQAERRKRDSTCCNDS